MSKSQGSTHVHCYPVALFDTGQLVVVATGLPCSTVRQPVRLDATARLSDNFGAVAYEEVEESLYRYVSSAIANHSKRTNSQLVDILTRCLVSLYEQEFKPALWVYVSNSTIVIWCAMQSEDDEDADEGKTEGDEDADESKTEGDEDKFGVAKYGWLEIVCGTITSTIRYSTNPIDAATEHGLLIVDRDSCYGYLHDIPKPVQRVLDGTYDFLTPPTATPAN